MTDSTGNPLQRVLYKAAGIFLLLLLAIILSGCATTMAGDEQIIKPEPGSSEAAETELSAQPHMYPGKADGDLFLWEMKREGRSLFLLGSIHLASDMIYPLDERILEAFAASEILVEEVDIVNADMQEAQEYIAEHSTLAEGRVLSDYIPPEEEELLLDILDRYGIPYSTVENLQPWVVSNTLGMLSSFEVDMKPQYGLDVYFAREAQQTGMDIYALETVTQQFKMMNAISIEAQAYSLKETIREFMNLDEYMYGILETWAAGDAGAMEDILLEGMTGSASAREYYDRIIIGRNIDWAEQLLRLFQDTTGSNIFAVVGAGHLVGSESLVQLLINEGFAARRY